MLVNLLVVLQSRFFGFSVLNSIALRSVLYPLTVIKTRLQVEHSTLRNVILTFLIITSGSKTKASHLQGYL